ncbi:hypothetical protein AB9K35_16380 [Leisingera sp. XS_AS12]
MTSVGLTLRKRTRPLKFANKDETRLSISSARQDFPTIQYEGNGRWGVTPEEEHHCAKLSTALALLPDKMFSFCLFYAQAAGVRFISERLERCGQ